MVKDVQYEGEISCEKSAEKTYGGRKEEVDGQTSEASEGQISGDTIWDGRASICGIC